MLFILYTQPLFDRVMKHTVSYHAFANDNQLFKVSTLDEIHQSTETFPRCIIDVKTWINTNKLQLVDTKTEAMIALWNRISVHTSLLSVIHIGDTNIPFVSFLKNLGVTLDSNLSMSQHINNTCKTAYIQIRHRRSIRHTYKSGTPLLYGIHTNQAHQFSTVSSYHSSNSNPCWLSCSLSFRSLYLPTLRLPSVSARQTSKSSERCWTACI